MAAVIKELPTGQTKRIDFIIILFIILLIGGLYGRVINYDFIGFDDNYYVYENQRMIAGLSLQSFFWAFSFTEDTYWHPLTWLSLLIDAELFGLEPGFFHLINVIFHIFNSILLYLLLRRMTGEVGKSAFVAIIFAVHPLNVESVAWITERKNVLSTFFSLLTLISYTYFVEKPGFYRYATTMLLFLMGILSKPMVVTLPFIFILLDLWPLGRIQILQTGKKKYLFSLLEKLPFFLLSLISAVVTSLSLSRQKMEIGFDVVPLTLRVANAITSYVHYLIKLFFPTELAIYYPFPSYIPIWKSLASFLFLLTVTGYFIYQFKFRKYLLIGWLWYLGTLIPVIGIKQAGLWPAIADRWVYLPAIGLFISITWFVSDIAKSYTRKREFAVLCSIIIIILSVITSFQLAYWVNSEKIFSRTVNVTQNNWIIHYNLGKIYEEKGKIDEAVQNYEEALAINPRDKDTANALGALLFNQGKKTEAIEYYNMSIKIDPGYHLAYRNKGIFHVYEGEYENALRNYLKALSLHSPYGENSEFLYEMGYIYWKLKQFRVAIKFLDKSLYLDSKNTKAKKVLKTVVESIQKVIENIKEDIAVNPDNPMSYYALGNKFLYLNDIENAISSYEKALHFDPGFADALYNLAIIYSEKKEYDKAISLFKRILLLNTDAYPIYQIYYNISCLYSLSERSEPSLEYLEKAIKNGYDNYKKLKQDKRLDYLRKQTKFEELLKAFIQS